MMKRHTTSTEASKYSRRPYHFVPYLLRNILAMHPNNEFLIIWDENIVNQAMQAYERHYVFKDRYRVTATEPVDEWLSYNTHFRIEETRQDPGIRPPLTRSEQLHQHQIVERFNPNGFPAPMNVCVLHQQLSCTPSTFRPVDTIVVLLSSDNRTVIESFPACGRHINLAKCVCHNIARNREGRPTDPMFAFI